MSFHQQWASAYNPAMPLPDDPLFIATVLCVNVVIAEWLVQKTFCRHLGTALMVIVVTAVAANAGIIRPARSVVYDWIFDYVAPLAIFWLLLQVNLRSILAAGLPMVGLFLLGCLATTIGVVCGLWIVDGSAVFGEQYGHLGAMFVGTYTGGSVNFNAIALHYGVNEEAGLYVGAMVVDNIMTTLWMLATIILPRLLTRLFPGRAKRSLPPNNSEGGAYSSAPESLNLMGIAILSATGMATLWFSDWLAARCTAIGFEMPSILILTTIALFLAQIPIIHRLTGATVLGMFAVYLFLAVIGAYCDLKAIAGLGTLGPPLLLFVGVTVGMHGIMTFGIGLWVKADVDMIAVASQANIGGGTSALALAESLGRPDLVLPGILVGSLGTALGTYLGFGAANYLL